jgi:hypothetical protein
MLTFHKLDAHRDAIQFLQLALEAIRDAWSCR